MLTFIPAWCKFSAISKPINPPPTTTACFGLVSVTIYFILSESGIVLNTYTRSELIPGIGGLMGSAPGDNINLSYDSV